MLGWDGAVEGLEPSTALEKPWLGRPRLERLATPPRQRQVLAWTLAGFTPSEIAQELGLTSDAVRANLMKGRRRAALYLKTREENR
ncbi:sigma factor-like helix-turn-helix DNA-binding protein [Embleya sp. NBC_00896]|uniref:sigma factor-like helix-turn-helix DNA-binding protein n=1 Tax=Embleya sp. NBC_00896 TaxID=2975961 RepID=UPI002F91AE93|nr:LuxR C-terminal-related transcriptional regulator [Embleya sp. NBC_00896]